MWRNVKTQFIDKLDDKTSKPIKSIPRCVKTATRYANVHNNE